MSPFQSPASPLLGGRLTALDALRGIVMVLMVLDHTRDFFSDARISATDPATSNLPLFFTRWVTHFCAPLFVFLAGASAYLAGALKPGLAGRGLAGFVAGRGLLLIVLELSLVRLGLFFDWSPDGMFLQVFWAIGGSLVLLGMLVFLGVPPGWMGVLGGAIVVGHNAIDLAAGPAGMGFERAGPLPPWWFALLLRPGRLGLPGGITWFVGYPLLPWFGILALGYAFGPILLRGRPERVRITVALGLAATLAFVVLRALSGYGDPRPFQPLETPAKSLMAFLNCQKYPPSLLYALMTLGPGLLALAVLDAAEGGLNWGLKRGHSTFSTSIPPEALGQGKSRTSPFPTAEALGPGQSRTSPFHAGAVRRGLVTLGRVPLFYYLLQWPVIHGLAIGVNRLLGHAVPLSGGPFSAAMPDHSLAFVYAMWGLIVAILFVPCRWYAGLKLRRKDWRWLSYL